MLLLVLCGAIYAQNAIWRPTPSNAMGFGQNIGRIGDIDGDGADDFAISRRDGIVEVVSGLTGAQIRTHALPPDAGSADCTGIGDVNGDFVPDYALGAAGARNAALGLQSAGAGWAAVFSGASGMEIWHVFGSQWFLQLGARVVGAGDLDGNGINDVLISTPGWGVGFGSLDDGRVRAHDGASGVVIWEVVGTSSPQEQLGLSLDSCHGDVNGDGRPDVLVLSGTPRRVKILSGLSGSVLFTFNAATQWLDVAGLGDVDGDGIADFGVGMFDQPWDNGSASVYSTATGLQIYNRAFTAGYWTSFGGRVHSCADVTGDGVRELAVGCSGTYTYTTLGHVKVYDGAAGTLLLEVDGRVEAYGSRFGSEISSGDADGDGHLELLVAAPRQVGTSAYAGRVEVHELETAGGIRRHLTNCGPVGIAMTGSSLLGGQVRVRLSSQSGFPSLGYGFTVMPIAFCTCQIGHEWSLVSLLATSETISIPQNPTLVGAALAVQGLDFGGATTCSGLGFALSDTMVLRIQ